ncbi:MAG: nitrogenase component 1 [Lachnospiraceae bacterium]|nr:nitrogenase component 1 [Lachnospiraceae bacterium]
MLKHVMANEPAKAGSLKIGEASYPQPFYMGLEYSTPARGMWNIAQTGFLMPETHQIFVCAYGCLRGVVLTAAEMNALDRYSAIAIRENDIINGTIEKLMVDGVNDVLAKLPKKPKCIQLFITCQHFFMSYDHNNVFERIRKEHPDIEILDCYMIPAMRKSGISPDQRMRRQMTRVWKERTRCDEKKINIIGSNLRLSDSAELRGWLTKNGFELKSIHDCSTFDEYVDMENAAMNIYYEPVVAAEMKDLKERLGMDSFYFSNSFDPDEIDENYRKLAERLSIPAPDFSELRKQADAALTGLKELIKDTPVVLDYTLTTRIFSFAKMLTDHGINVTAVCTDLVQPDDKAAFESLKETHPGICILATNQPESRFFASEHEKNEGSQKEEKVLAVGQKAAYFFATDNFVNVAEGGGFLGYDGIIRFTELMADGFLNKKDRRKLIRVKGFGCESCI